MFPEPCIQFAEAHLPGFVKTDQVIVGREVLELKALSIDLQECTGHGDRDALVAVDERVILGKALPHGSRFFDQIAIIAALWSRQAASSAPRSRMPSDPPNLAIRIP
jgi:hypothetical protein